MRLTFKLTLVLVTALTGLFVLYGYLALRHQAAYLEQDTRRDALQIGKALGLAVARVWRQQGSAEAIALVAEANDRTSEYQIRLTQIDNRAPEHLRPHLDPGALSKLQVGRPVLKRILAEQGKVYFYSYVQVPLERPEALAIEVRESLASASSFQASSVWQIGVFLGAVVLTTAALLIFFGHLLVGRRLNVIRKATQRIGAGDLSVELTMPGRDEVALLARDINKMSAEILRTRELLQRESDERVKALEQLRHADRLASLGSLATGVAHELGTPLSVVSGHAANLAGALSDSTHLSKEVEGIVRQADRMSGIVRQLLEFGRAGPAMSQQVDLGECLKRVYDLLLPFAQRRYVPLLLVPPMEPFLLQGDPSQLEQVFTNIVLNAIQATDSGEVRMQVERRRCAKPGNGVQENEWACIHIHDKGAGMDAPTLARVFDPYFTTKPVGQGTGMGLSIAHGIVVEHGGWVDVQSEIGRGTSFFVYLPRTNR